MALRFASVAKTYFIVVGVLTTVLLVFVLAASVWLALTLPVSSPAKSTTSTVDGVGETYDHPLLSPQQERAARSFGIDIKTLPTELTADQQRCAVAAIGVERAQQILSGTSPTLLDVARAKHCFGY